MNIAFLILATKNTQQLRRLIRSFSYSEKYQFFIHVDSKFDLEEFRNKTGNSNNTNYIVNRYSIFWGGFSMIEATVELINHALSNSNADIFCLLSDDSAILFDENHVTSSLSKTQNRISIYNPENNPTLLSRYNQYYLLDSNMTSPRYVPLEYRSFNPLFIKYHEKYLNFLNSWGGKKQITPMHGSQWWTLSRIVLEKIIEVIKNDAHLYESFRYTAIPDESLFQTIISEYKIDIGTSQNSPMYVDFNKEPKPYIFKSREEIKGVNTENKLFIRKVSADFL